MQERITDFLKNIWTVRCTFTKLYVVDLEIVMSDQVPLYRNESSNEKILLTSEVHHRQHMARKIILSPESKLPQ